MTGLLVESLLLAGVGGVLGLGLAQALLTGLVALAPAGTPRIVDGGARRARARLLAAGDARDRRSLRPAACVQRHPRAARGGAADRRPRAFVARGAALARPLVTGQMALALVLVLAATLVVRSMVRPAVRVARLRDRARGGGARQAAAGRAIPTPRARLAFFEELERRLSARPGVEAVAFANTLPLTRRLGHRGRGGGPPEQDRRGGDDVDAQAVSRGYFRALGIPHLRGRGFEEGDREGAPYVALVNEDFARLSRGRERDRQALPPRQPGALGQRRRRRGLAAARRPGRRAHAADLPARRADRHLPGAARRRRACVATAEPARSRRSCAPRSRRSTRSSRSRA